ncbi:MAG: DUF1320 domain-containing protein [Nitrospirales bacterium]|nr:DUF1320 domain-containing protein [Nitrospirales bacterium]
MSYSTLDDLRQDISEEGLIQLTDDDGLGMVNEAVYESARDDADSLIDGYLVGGGYTVPLATVPGLIGKLSRDISLYNLHKRRLRLNVPKELEDSYKGQLSLLRDIQAGKVRIGIETAQEGAYRTNKTSDDRVFTKDILAGF